MFESISRWALSGIQHDGIDNDEYIAQRQTSDGRLMRAEMWSGEAAVMGFHCFGFCSW